MILIDLINLKGRYVLLIYNSQINQFYWSGKSTVINKSSGLNQWMYFIIGIRENVKLLKKARLEIIFVSFWIPFRLKICYILGTLSSQYPDIEELWAAFR